ncbi:uncharacterized protein CDAR_246231 [Caerostris darwini]|uniref:Uncharacterized protein n=1 Tax=Caerostris darwini TaxID=1538125 RepID=A0AAV4WAG4_9ARAC|nr:uncharacterized protein CDAR_246231 [Caerostris darwini]
MGGGKTSSDSDIEISSNRAENCLLEFYRKQFEELQRKDDKYKQRIDKHLRDLVADRHELEAEVLRRGEKISDLQKALVDLQLTCFEERERFLNVTAENEKLKKNEERLHENIRHLLKVTKDKDLQDKIIYILQDPNVEIGVRYSSKSAADKISGLYGEKSSDELLKTEIQRLQKKLDDHSKISQNKSDIILEDCKSALSKSRVKLLQDEEEIAFFKRKLQEAENELSKFKQAYSELRVPNKENIYTETLSKNADKYSDRENIRHERKPHNAYDNTLSKATDLHLTLVLLLKVLNKVLSLLASIQTTQVYTEAAKLPKSHPNSEKFVHETNIVQLQSSVRQCTRLSFDISNLWKILYKAFTNREIKTRELNLEWELKQLEWIVEELAVVTAESDLLCISLTRSTFFDYLTGPKKPFEKFGVKETNSHFKYTSDIVKMEDNLKSAKSFVTKAVKITEKFIEVYANQSKNEKLAQVDSSLLKDTENLNEINKPDSKGPYQAGLSSRINLFTTEKSVATGALNRFDTKRGGKKIHSDHVDATDLTRKIDKTLSKINQLESGEYTKDDEFCKHLSEQVNALAERLKALHNEFNVKNIREQFSEYSSLTLSKLETLARQSRDAVAAAEAQIAAHRDNSNLLSQKLKDTEELLRESINECLGLKQKLHLEQLQRETDKVQFSRGLQKLQQISHCKDLETAIKEIANSINIKESTDYRHLQCFNCHHIADHKFCNEKIQDLKASNPKWTKDLREKHDITCCRRHETFFKEGVYSDSQTEPTFSVLLECIHCKQETRHKLCNEKIKELSASNRKLLEELKEEQQTSGRSTREPTSFYVPVGCMHCKHGEQHKFCNEKISELRTNNQRLASQLKEKQESDFKKFETAAIDAMSTFPKKKTTDVLFDPINTYVCPRCMQGSEHQVCNEKIREMRVNNRKLMTELKLLQQEVKEEKKMSKMGHEQIIKANHDFAAQCVNLKETVGMLEKKNASLLEQLKLERNRVKNIERYRHSEIEGFQTDIKNLKAKIQDMEKQLVKAVLIFEHDKRDEELLKAIHATAQNSKQTTGAIRRLKGKLYELEHDIKNL